MPPAAGGVRNPIERLRLIGDDESAIAGFLDEIDIRSPREREMLAELARTSPLARPERFESDHRHAIEALESLRRHGFGSRAASEPGRCDTGPQARGAHRALHRRLVRAERGQLDAQPLLGSRDGGDLGLDRVQAASPRAIRRAGPRRDHAFTRDRRAVLRRRRVADPPRATLWRLANGFRFDSWWVALLVGLAGIALASASRG